MMHRTHKFISRWVALLGILFVTRTMTAAEVDREVPVPLSPELRARCVEVLRAGFKSDEFWPSMHAAEGLTLAGETDEVRQALGPRVAAEQDDQRRCGLARELVRAGDSSHVHWMLEILAKPDPYGHNHAAESLYKVKEIGDGRMMRAALEQQRDERLRMMAAAALGRSGDQEAIEFVRSRVTSGETELRRVAAWILGLLGDDRDIEPLARQRDRETDPLIRAYIVNALACRGDAEGIRELGRQLNSPDAMIRTYSAEFAGYSRAVEYRDRLIELLDDENVDVRVRAAQSLIALSLQRDALGYATGRRQVERKLKPSQAD